MNWSGKKLCPSCRKEWKNPHVAYDFLNAIDKIAALSHQLRLSSERTGTAALANRSSSKMGLNSGFEPDGHDGKPAIASGIGITSGFEAYRDMIQRARQAPLSSLAGRIRRRLGIDGLGEADMSLREVGMPSMP